MTVWDDLQGQPAVVEQLRQATLGEGLTHAWLFTGPPGSGRSNAAKAFAAALNCDQEDVTRRGCGECHECRTALGGTHADVDVIATEGLSIKVEQARDLVALAARHVQAVFIERREDRGHLAAGADDRGHGRGSGPVLSVRE